MTPKEFQYGTVQKRLESLRRLLGELEKYQHVEADHLRANLSEMYAVFFMIQQINDLSTDINQHIATTTLDIVDSNSRRGFETLIRAGILPKELEQDFSKSAALRNIITHQYVEVDLDIIAESIPRVLQLYGRYVNSVAGWLAGK